LNHFDKIILASSILLSGIHCSNTNHEKKTSNFSKKGLATLVYHADSAFSPAKIKTIDNYFKNRYALNQFNGAILFYQNGKSYANAYGYANGKIKTALSPDLPFQIASVSKTLTAYTALSLIDQKLLAINTPVYEILPGFPYKNIDISHLLSHKSGIPNYMYFAESFYKTKYRQMTNEDVLWMLKRYRPKLEFNPNARYKYSNTNYILLALIIEKLTNLPFERYMKDSVFKVIGMNNSYIYTPRMTLKGQPVQGHSDRRTIFPEFYQNGTMGDKGVYTTVYDMLIFDQALRQNLLISANTLNMACTPHTPCRPTNDYYGYGWRIRYYNNGDTIIYHNGWWQGYKAYFVRWKNKDQCIIVFANTTKGGFIKQDELMSLMEGIKPKAVVGGDDGD